MNHHMMQKCAKIPKFW